MAGCHNESNDLFPVAVLDAAISCGLSLDAVYRKPACCGSRFQLKSRVLAEVATAAAPISALDRHRPSTTSSFSSAAQRHCHMSVRELILDH